MLYDLFNPWAFIGEIHSTHPVTGKRIRALMTQTNQPLISFSSLIARTAVNKAKMRKSFLGDITQAILPAIVGV